MSTRFEDWRIGDLMIHGGVCSSEELEAALLSEQSASMRIGQVLVETGIVVPALIDTVARSQALVRTGHLTLNDAVDRIMVATAASYYLQLRDRHRKPHDRSRVLPIS